MHVYTKQGRQTVTRTVQQTVQHIEEGWLSGREYRRYISALSGHTPHTPESGDKATDIRVEERSGHAFFALIIGINEYHHQCRELPNLKGCVADADEMHDYLTTDRRVPPPNITNLRNSQATRAEIIKAIQRLSQDNRIQKDDAIVIYYAGHGAETKRPSNWPGTNTEIQMLLPHDFEPSTTQNEDGQGILDITLSLLLGELAYAKGDNITVIMDCCHSGSSTRSAPTHGADEDGSCRRARLPQDYQVLSSIYDHLWQNAQRIRKAGLNTHVLLAATSCTGFAREKNGRGAFTVALLEFLRHHQSTLRLSYKEVIRSLPKLIAQDPQCEGTHSSRLPFCLERTVPEPYICVTKEKDQHLTLHAGEIEDIEKDATFDLYERNNAGDFVFRATTKLVGAPGASRSSLKTPSSLAIPQATALRPVPLWALKTSTHKITVALPAKPTFLPLIVETVRKTDQRQNIIQLVDLGHACDLTLSVDSGPRSNIWFAIADQKYIGAGAQRLAYAVPFYHPLVLARVLRGAADFFHYLRQENTQHPLVHSESVLLESYTLYEDQHRIMQPRDTNLNLNGVVKVDANRGGNYGFKIINNSAIPLYCWAFFFEMSDLCIWPIYTPSSSHDGNSADVSIPGHGGELTLGYGSGGADPLRITQYRTHPNRGVFSHDDEASVDISYLKIFLTTQHVDLAHMEQLTPFFTAPTAGSMSTGRTRNGRKVPRKSMPIDLWDTLTLAVVSRNRDD